MITAEMHTSYYIRLVTPEVNYFLSTTFGWVCKGMPFDIKSMVRDKKEIERIEQLVIAHATETALKQFNLYLSAKKMEVKSESYERL